MSKQVNRQSNDVEEKTLNQRSPQRETFGAFGPFEAVSGELSDDMNWDFLERIPFVSSNDNVRCFGAVPEVAVVPHDALSPVQFTQDSLHEMGVWSGEEEDPCKSTADRKEDSLGLLLEEHGHALQWKLASFRQYLREHANSLSAEEMSILKRERRKFLNRGYQQRARDCKRETITELQQQLAVKEKNVFQRVQELVVEHFGSQVAPSVLVNFFVAFHRMERAEMV